MATLAIHVERDCAVSAAKLWEALVQPVLWWGRDILLEPRVGGEFHEPWQDANGLHHTRGKVTVFDPPERLGLSWSDDDWDFETDVTFLISGEEQGSRITLCHTGWQAAPGSLREDLVASHSHGWNFHLDNLLACAGESA